MNLTPDEAARASARLYEVHAGSACLTIVAPGGGTVALIYGADRVAFRRAALICVALEADDSARGVVEVDEE